MPAPTPTEAVPLDAPRIEVRTLAYQDLREALTRGLDDFRAFPTHAIFLVAIYPIVGLLLGQALLRYDFVPLLFPIAAGFALIGPFAAVGLYELSRRREQGLPVRAGDAAGVLRSPAWSSILALGSLLAAVFVLWLFVAAGLFAALFGDRGPASIADFLGQVFGTREGWIMIVAGNLIGAAFALFAFAVSVISFPLLLDRNVGAPAAALASVRVVLANPLVMAAWGLIVAGGLALGSIPFFVGLAVVLPVLGHATWHLYRRAIV
jgi:uncharacterized membrane protein